MIAATPVVAVAPVGSAAGVRTAAAALACVASAPDRAALLVDLGARGAPRPTPVATAAARELEERLAAHLPGVGVASRGSTCHLEPGEGALEAVAAALPLVRDAAAVLEVPPALLLPLAEERRVGLTAALLRAELPRDRSLTALAAGELIGRGVRVAVLRRAPGRLVGALARLGAAPSPVRGLPDRVAGRVLAGSARRRGDGGAHDA